MSNDTFFNVATSFGGSFIFFVSFHHLYSKVLLYEMNSNNKCFSLHAHGIDHLIRLLARTIYLSCIHSWTACQSFFLDSPHLPYYASIAIAFPSLQIFQIALRGWWVDYRLLEKRERLIKIRSHVPWSVKLLPWPLDHATPLNFRRGLLSKVLKLVKV